MVVTHPETQSRPAKTLGASLRGRPALEPGAEFMIRCNERIADEVREFCIQENISQRAFWEESAARLLFQERLRQKREAILGR